MRGAYNITLNIKDALERFCIIFLDAKSHKPQALCHIDCFNKSIHYMPLDYISF